MKDCATATINLDSFNELLKESEELKRIKTAISKAYMVDYYYINREIKNCKNCNYSRNCDKTGHTACKYEELLILKLEELILATKKYALYEKKEDFYDLENAVVEVTQ